MYRVDRKASGLMMCNEAGSIIIYFGWSRIAEFMNKLHFCILII